MAITEIDSEFQVKKCKILLDYEQKLNDFKEKQEYNLEYYLGEQNQKCYANDIKLIVTRERKKKH